MLGSARPDGVAAAPAFAGFVVAHGGDDVIINVAGFLERRGIAGGLLAGEFGDGAVEGNKLVGFEIALQEGIVGGERGGGVLQCGGMDVHRVLAACGVEEESDVVTCSGLGGRRIEDGEGILVFGIAAFGVWDGAFDFKIGYGLKGVVLRERDPEMAGFCVSIGGELGLIS